MFAHPLLAKVTSWMFASSPPQEGTAIDWQTVSDEHTQWNVTNAPYFWLPQEIHTLVLLNLPAEDILNSAQVCKAWRNAAHQEHLWRNMYQRDSPSWQLLSNHASSRRSNLSSSNGWRAMLSVSDSSDSENEEASRVHSKWRDAYLQQYRLNRSRFAPSQVAAKLSLLSSESSLSQWELRLPFARKVHRVLMFGEGLETSARKLLYTLMWSKNSPFQMTRAYPGVEGVGSGFGFRVGHKELALAALYKYDTPGVFDRVRPQWRELFLSTSGFVFVVDPQQDLARARADLATFMDAEWIPPHAPLLILVVHSQASKPKDGEPHDDETNKQQHEMPSMVAVAEALQLTARRSKQYLVRYCAWPDGLHGVVDGISWLSENL